uniref:Opsin n=1 Tax=Dendrocoelum lacteum TaxID=27895 RepID=T1D132_9PLAT
MSLAIGDLTFLAVNGFPLLTISSFNTRWAWGKLTCEIYGFIGGLFGFISINTMVLISLDRYFVIAQPFQGMKALTMKRAIVMVVLAWVYSFIWASPPFWGYGSYVPEGFQTSCTFDYLTQSKGNIIFNIGMYICNFLLPVTIIIFCYYQIVKAVRLHELEMLKMAHQMNATHPTSMKTGSKKADIQAAKISVIIVFLYLLSWTPYAIIALMALTGKRDHLNPYTAELPVLFAKTSAMYNPFIYAINHPKFRIQLEKKLPCLICCCPPKAKEREMTSAVSATKPTRYQSEKESTMSQLDSEAPPKNQDGSCKTNNGYEEDKM